MNKLLSITRSTIPYVKGLRPTLKTVTACLLMQQLEYWFERYTSGFYKFLNPAPNHERYVAGDSWNEELEFSDEEFHSAFNRIGVRWKSRSEFANAQNKFIGADGQEQFYCSYYDRLKGLTFYFRNHSLVDRFLDSLVTIEHKNSGSASRSSQSSVNRQCRDRESDKDGIMNISDITSDTTTRREPLAEIQKPQLELPNKKKTKNADELTDLSEASFINDPLWKCLMVKMQMNSTFAQNNNFTVKGYWSLKKSGATIEQLSLFFEWWMKFDWRGKKGELPTMNELLDNWQRASIQNNSTANGNDTNKQERKSLSTKPLNKFDQNMKNLDMAFEILGKDE